MKRLLLPTLLSLCVLGPAQAAGAAAWVQYVAGGGAEVRAIADGKTCPTLLIDGAAAPMQVRAEADQNFALVCSAPLPAAANAASVAGIALPLPVANPQRIMVFGDTGCRIKGTIAQACNDPKAWPFAGIAKAAAALKPDLVLHVGDYLYRESPCPDGQCRLRGFAPRRQLDDLERRFLHARRAAARRRALDRRSRQSRGLPARRSGFLRLLGPVAFDPKAPCTDHLAPRIAHIGSQAVAVMDNASASTRRSTTSRCRSMPPTSER